MKRWLVLRKLRRLAVLGQSLTCKKVHVDLEIKRVVKKATTQFISWETICKKTVSLSGIERHNLIQVGLSTRIVMAALPTNNASDCRESLGFIG